MTKSSSIGHATDDAGRVFPDTFGVPLIDDGPAPFNHDSWPSSTMIILFIVHQQLTAHNSSQLTTAHSAQQQQQQQQ